MLGAYVPARWKTDEDDAKPVERIVLCTPDGAGLSEGAGRVGLVGKWVNAARDLANSPPNELTPEVLAERAAKLARAESLRGGPRPAGIDELGMGALSAVGRASANGQRLIVLRYEPAQGARDD